MSIQTTRQSIKQRFDNWEAAMKAPTKPATKNNVAMEVQAIFGDAIANGDGNLPTPKSSTNKNTFGGIETKSGKDMPTESKVANAIIVDTYYNVKEGYYLGYSIKAGAFVCSDRKASDTNVFYDGDNVANMIHGFSYVNYKRVVSQLTRAEFDNLVKAKLPWDAIRKCYVWESNWNNFVSPIRFNFKSPNLVF